MSVIVNIRGERGLEGTGFSLSKREHLTHLFPNGAYDGAYFQIGLLEFQVIECIVLQFLPMASITDTLDENSVEVDVVIVLRCSCDDVRLNIPDQDYSDVKSYLSNLI